MEYFFQTELRLYFVMPFISGGELIRLHKAQSRFTESVAKFYAAQIIIGVGKLHEKGIVHRDLKLDNVMIDSNGYLKIIDFGFAKVLQSHDVATTQCGTPEYFAPEVLTSANGYDKNVDWWSMGVIIYELIIGWTPFYSPNRHVLYQKIRKGLV